MLFCIQSLARWQWYLYLKTTKLVITKPEYKVKCWSDLIVCSCVRITVLIHPQMPNNSKQCTENRTVFPDSILYLKFCSWCMTFSLFNKKHRRNFFSCVCLAGYILCNLSHMFQLYTVTSATHLSSIFLKVSYIVIPPPTRLCANGCLRLKKPLCSFIVQAKPFIGWIILGFDRLH